MNKIKLTLILVIISCAAVHGQVRKYKVGVEVYTNSSQSITTTDDFFTTDSIWSSVEGSKPSVSASINLSFNLTPKLNISAGVGIQNTGYSIRNNAVRFENSLEPEGYVKLSYNYTYVDIPINLRYYFKESFYLNSGASASFYVNNSVKEKTNIEGISSGMSRDQSANFREINGSINLGLGYDFLKLKGTTLSVEPRAQIAVGDLVTGTVINRRLWSFGINLGAKF